MSGELKNKGNNFLLQLIWENKSVNITKEINENVVQPGIENGSLDYRKYTLTTQPLNRLCWSALFMGLIGAKSEKTFKHMLCSHNHFPIPQPTRDGWWNAPWEITN